MTNNSVFWGASLILLGIWQIRKRKVVKISEKNIDFFMLTNVLITIYGFVSVILDLNDEICAILFGIMYFRYTYTYNKRNTGSRGNVRGWEHTLLAKYLD